MAKRKSKKSKAPISFLIGILAILILIFVGTKVIYKCDECGKLSFGAGYQPDLVSASFDDETRVCEDCAREEHKIVLALGTSTIEDFKLDIHWFGDQTETDE